MTLFKFCEPVTLSKHSSNNANNFQTFKMTTVVNFEETANLNLSEVLELIRSTVTQNESKEVKYTVTRQHVLAAIKSFFQPLATKVKVLSSVYPMVISITYQERNNLWAYRWCRQTRGSCFAIYDDHVACVKMLLQRGAELTGKFHTHTSSESSRKSVKRLDAIQQEVSTKINNDEDFEAVVSAKRDGCLVGVNIYKKDTEIANLMERMASEQKYQYHSDIINACKEDETFPYVVVLSSNGTLFMYPDMKKYVIGATETKNAKKLTNYLIDTVKQFTQNAENVQTTACLCFEAVWNKKKRRGLTVKYNKSSFLFLGCTVIEDSVDFQFKPHFTYERHQTPWMQPLHKCIRSASELKRIIVDLDKLAVGEMKQSEYLQQNWDVNDGDVKDEDDVDYEGVVLYYPHQVGDVIVYDYSKIKTPLYYMLHKVKAKDVPRLVNMPPCLGNAYHSMDITRFRNKFELFVTHYVDKFDERLNSEIKDSTSSPFYMELDEKNSDTLFERSDNVIKKMYVNKCRNAMASLSKEIITDYPQITGKLKIVSNEDEWIFARGIVMTILPLGNMTVSQCIEDENIVVKSVYEKLRWALQ